MKTARLRSKPFWIPKKNESKLFTFLLMVVRIIAFTKKHQYSTFISLVFVRNFTRFCFKRKIIYLNEITVERRLTLAHSSVSLKHFWDKITIVVTQFHYFLLLYLFFYVSHKIFFVRLSWEKAFFFHKWKHIQHHLKVWLSFNCDSTARAW